MNERDEMRAKLVAYMAQLFKDAPDTQENRDLKEDMTQNLLDKYDDLTLSGSTPAEAYAETVSGVGDISELVGKNQIEHSAPTVTEAVPLQAKPAEPAEPARPPKKRVSKAVWLVPLIIVGSLVTVLGIAVPFALLADNVFDFQSVVYGDMNYDAAGYEYGDFTLTQPITQLEIDWVAGEVNVSVTDKDVLSCQEAWHDGTAVETDQALRYKVTGSKLCIKYCKPISSFTMQRSKTLNVVIPAEWTAHLQTVIVNTASGAVNVRTDAQVLEIDGSSCTVSVNGHYDSLNIDTASGDIAISGTAQKLEADSASGKIFASGTFGTVELNSASGQIQFRGNADEFELDGASGKSEIILYNSPRSIKLDASGGDIDLILSADCTGFTLSVDKGSGKVYIKDFPVLEEKGTYVSGDGKIRISVDIGSADFTVSKGEAVTSEGGQ